MFSFCPYSPWRTLVGLVSQTLSSVLKSGVFHALPGLLLPKQPENSKTAIWDNCSVQSCLTLCNPMDCSTPSFPVHHQLPELAQTHVHWVDDAIQPLHPPLSLSPPAFNLSQHQGLLYESALHIRWPEYWSFSFCISPLNKYSGLISFRIDWLDLLAVQGTLKSLLQHHTSKASILQHSAFFIVRHDYWKNHSFDYMDLSQQSNVSAF